MSSPFSGDAGRSMLNGSRERVKWLYGRCRILSDQPVPVQEGIRLVTTGGLQRNRRQLPIQFVKLLGRQGGIEQMLEVFIQNGVLDCVIKIG